MKWRKLGRIFEPGRYPWCITHGMLPTPLHLSGDLYRVYFSGRDKDNHSHIGYVDIDLTKPTEIQNMSEKPILSPGVLGTFDDCGVSPLHARWDGKVVLLYYMGWHQDGVVRASEMTGLAVGDIDHLIRYSQAPILERTRAEPYSISVLSCVLKEGDKWRGWYDSCDRWLSPALPQYNIKYCESLDGCHWERRGQISVDYLPKETRISRASVIKPNRDFYWMWYCYAIGDNGYRIGCGVSEDGIEFARMDDRAIIELSETGWDSEMVCYPQVFEHGGQLWMLYSGNGYGREGFGIAIEE